MLLPTLSSNARTKSANTEHAEKSKYYLRQSFKYSDSTDNTFELLRHAYKANPGNQDVAYNYGIQSLLSGDTLSSDLMASMLKYIDTYPDDYSEAWLLAQVMRILKGNVDESIKIMSLMKDRFPERTDILNELSNLYMMNNETDKALAMLRLYEHIEGASENTVSSKANILMTTLDTPAAIAAVDSFVMMYPDREDSHSLRGLLYMFLEKPDSALVSYKKAESLAPYSYQPKHLLSLLYQSQGDTVRADSLMIEALATNDLNVEDKAEGLMSYLSEVISTNESSRRGLPLVDALLDQDPENTVLLTLKETILKQLQMWPETYGIIRKLIAQYPQDSKYWEELMINHIMAKDYAGADKVYNEAADSLKDNHYNLDFIIATSYGMDEQNQKAADKLKGLLTSLVPSYSDTLSGSALADTVQARNYNSTAMANYLQTYADQLIALKDSSRGFNVYEQALALDPTNTLALNNYAYGLAVSRKDLAKAAEMAMQCINQSPDNGTFLDTYAYILFLQGDYEKALAYQEMAIENTAADEISAELYEHYGDILYKLHKKRLAIDNWKRALEQEPDNELLKRKIHDEKYYDK